MLGDWKKPVSPPIHSSSCPECTEVLGIVSWGPCVPELNQPNGLSHTWSEEMRTPAFPCIAGALVQL